MIKLVQIGLVNMVAQILSIDGAQPIGDIDTLSWLLCLYQLFLLLSTQTALISIVSIGIQVIVQFNGLCIRVWDHPLLFVNLYIEIIEEFNLTKTKMIRLPKLHAPDDFLSDTFDEEWFEQFDWDIPTDASLLF